MKNILIIILAAAAIGAGAFGVVEQNQLKKVSAQLADAQASVADLQAQLEKQKEDIDHAKIAEMKSKLFQQTLTEASANVAEQSKKTQNLEQSLAAAKTNGGMQGMMAMFKNPEMRKMIESQQKMVMGPMIAKQYSDFFKQLNLTSDQSDALKTILQNKMMASAGIGMSMMDGSMDEAQRSSLAEQQKAQNQDFDNQIKQLLGDDNYQSYEAYNKTIPARTAINQFNDQLTGSANALSPDQQQQLIQAMTDARNNYNWNAVLNQPKMQNGGQVDPMAALDNFTEPNIEQAAEENAAFDQHFLATVQQFLTPQQVTAFQQFQTNWRQMQTSALKMAAQFFPHGNK